MPAPALSRTPVAEGATRGCLAALCITQTTAWGVLHHAVRGVSPGSIRNVPHRCAVRTGSAKRRPTRGSRRYAQQESLETSVLKALQAILMPSAMVR
jgi:hypothetical protein